MTALYNENEPYAAQWLENLVAAGHIADGRVDARSIYDMSPNDLVDATQAHFFAGIGVWSYALRLAGWPDDLPVWTGSCPCQPFNVAGKRKGFEDDHHLWPVWFKLIQQCKPPIIFGEQIASPDGLRWFDLVSTDLEGAGYAVGAADTCAAGVGAPHIRQRLYFVAISDKVTPAWWRESMGERIRGIRTDGAVNEGQGMPEAWWGGRANALADADGYKSSSGGEKQSSGRSGDDGVLAGTNCISGNKECEEPGRSYRGSYEDKRGGLGCCGEPRFLGNTDGAGLERRKDLREDDGEKLTPTQRTSGDANPPLLWNFWADAEWIPCRDGKWRPAQSGSFPLAYGATARVGRLRSFGNALNAAQAQAFISAVMEVLCSPNLG
jgi:DNA (cytosine-5)-methyltransferase 1